MKIEIGKRYLMRNGFVTPPIIASTIDGKDYPFGVDCGSWNEGDDFRLTTWTKTGLIYAEGKYQNAMDLVAEFVGEVVKKTPKTLRLWFVQKSIRDKWLPEWVEEGLVPNGEFVRSCEETCLEGEETI